MGSHNLTQASQANQECVVQLGTVPSDANIAAYREWFTRLWDASSPIVIDHAPMPDRRLRAKTPAAGRPFRQLRRAERHALRQQRTFRVFLRPTLPRFRHFK